MLAKRSHFLLAALTTAMLLGNGVGVPLAVLIVMAILQPLLQLNNMVSM